MMYLEDVLELLKGFGVTDHPYMGKLDSKQEKSIGVYNSKHSQPLKAAIGGRACESYGLKHVTFLVHGNRSVRETEKIAYSLYEALRNVRESIVNETKIKFIQLQTNAPVDVGTDDAGVFEMVVEAVIVYEKER